MLSVNYIYYVVGLINYRGSFFFYSNIEYMFDIKIEKENCLLWWILFGACVCSFSWQHYWFYVNTRIQRRTHNKIYLRPSRIFMESIRLKKVVSS